MPTVLDLYNAGLSAFKPPAKLHLSEWADKYAILSAESSAEEGRWRTLPYQKGIMDAITSSGIEHVTVMKSARVGYTKILNHVVGYHIHQDAATIMVVLPTVEDAQGHSKDEIAPMLRDTPCLQNLVSDAKTRDSTNTILHKQFPGGTLSLVGANSPRGFRRVSRRIVLFDEIDGYPRSAGEEGDQIKLGIRRTEYYWNRKIVTGSTPTVKDFSRVERLYLKTDQRRYFVPCPECSHYQYLRWPNITWVDNDPSTASYKCENCSTLIPHAKKRWMIERGEWRPTAPGNGKHVGFHIWAAYSYSPNASWPQLVEEFLDAKSDPEALKTFVNTVLGEVWEDEYASKVGADSLLERASKEAYTQQTPPAGVLALTVGCDTQDDRLSLSVWGWGREEEAWLIDRVKLYGSPSRTEVWEQLDEVLSKPYTTEAGDSLKISCCAIDSGGHHTNEVYEYARQRAHLGVIAVKGANIKGKPPIGKPSKVDINYKGKQLKKGVSLFTVGVDGVKSLLFGRLKNIPEHGAGYIHFYPTITPDYFEELTAEKQILRFRNGFPERIWVKKAQVPNEALDEAVYAYAALHRLYQRYDRRSIWDQFERLLGSPGTSSAPQPAPPPPPRRSNFVTRW